MNARLIAFLLLWPMAALGQGFAGLGTDATGFAIPAPDPVFDFPADHGPHPDYRIEWWYVTANLAGPDGTDYGVQWTLFRSALAPGEGEGWTSPQVWFAHAAVTTPGAHHVAERFARGGIGQAGVTAQPFDAWIDDWQMTGETLDKVTLTASGTEFRYDLRLAAQGPLVFHGDRGFSAKSAEGQASYYYSQPFYRVEGVLDLPDGPVPVTGEAWLDREYSSQPLSSTQSGWDWFSLSFDTGDKLMGFRLRQTDGSAYTSATWIGADGATQAYGDGALIAEPLQDAEVAGREIPVTWRVTLPDRDIDVTVEALNPEAWMAVSIPYWEGPVRVGGSHAGRGYLEMTGYE
ncbi:Predicted secreted hydrolase [Mameliella alba]|uniref:lipocalin-like domain-containing protein n=1 Tax=Mameliella alba TaxID=561184 RepID=UPI00088DD051|nr:lipocalin-like domain-containing protein [Mameliella alba]OWV48352.1 iron ABC transporter permease [Mameliella alba]PTR40400.1 putative secreted hydrolase [Mameliella alba]GGF44670.1 iron ABC transporter permease [Mameliella alba]SDD01744.1 Predicted secreted hydrolase [Mameliella alba]